MYLDCIACIMNQALRAGRFATDDELVIRQLLNDVGMMIKDIPMEASPPEIGGIVYRRINSIISNSDPYMDIKETNIQKALAIYDDIADIVDSSDEPLLYAVKAAIAGNIIDFGVNKPFDIEKDIIKAMEMDFAVNHFDAFKSELNKAEYVLYIGDNAGEGVFDKILIERLGKPVIYAVRGIPIINDITLREAELIGLNDIARIVSSGVRSPGLIMSEANEEFIDIFNSADMIISKGQGNYEALSDNEKRIFFLLRAKCSIIARDIGVNEGDIVLL